MIPLPNPWKLFAVGVGSFLFGAGVHQTIGPYGLLPTLTLTAVVAFKLRNWCYDEPDC